LRSDNSNDDVPMEIIAEAEEEKDNGKFVLLVLTSLYRY
jgi:hypothetical protein